MTLKYEGPVSGISLLLACEWTRTDRITALPAVKQFQMRSFRNSQPEGALPGTTNGGYVWLHSVKSLSDSVAELQWDAIQRYMSGLYPTRFKSSGLSEIASSLISHPTFITANSGHVALRLHVYDADVNASTGLAADLTSALSRHSCVKLSPTGSDHVLVVVRVGEHIEWDLLTYSEFACIKKASVDARDTSRAAHKLRDALQHMHMSNFVLDKRLPALDVGAAPGGWTEVLIENGFSKVVAIDPGSMSSDLMAKKGECITHLAMRAQDASQELQGKTFSIIVCDVNKDSRSTINQFILPLLPFLASGAPLVITLKLAKRSTDSTISSFLEHAGEVFGGWVDRLNAYHFLGNTLNERTLIATRSRTVNEKNSCLTAKLSNFECCNAEAEWFRTLSCLVAWVNSNDGQLPMLHSSDKYERDLAKWVQKQKKQHASSVKRHAWNIAHAEACEQYSWWSWASEEEEFLDGIEMLQEWTRTHDGLPDLCIQRPSQSNPSLCDNHYFLGRWIRAQRRCKFKGLMTKDRQDLLEACPFWTWQFDWSKYEGLCKFPCNDESNSSAAIDRVVGPRFQCICGQLFVCSHQYEQCSQKHTS